MDDDPDRPTPAAIAAKPELPEHLEPVLEAFHILSKSRPIAAGFGGIIFQPIPASEALAVAETLGWPGLDFLRVIAPADALYVGRVNNQQQK